MDVLTSAQEEQELMRSCDLGVNSCMRKPVDFSEFVEVVGHIGLYWMLLNKTSQSRRT